MSRLAAAIRAKSPAVIPFVAGGDPSLDVLPDVMRALENAGAAAIEVGFAFSDPIADGPTIQAAYQRALDRGVTVPRLLETLKSVTGDLSVPVVAMVSQSIVHRRGTLAFCQALAGAGVTGLLVPDLPLQEAKAVTDAASSAGLESVLLVAPTTDADRRRSICALCTGFVYYLSVAGITGARSGLPADLAENVNDLRGCTDRPICVGFGISQAAQVREVAAVADGSIVGSALVKAMHEAEIDGGNDVAAAAGSFLRGLLGE